MSEAVHPNPNPTDTSLFSVVGNIDPPDGGQFGVVEGGVVRCFTCREVFPAASVSADSSTRLEGASDPADMVMVVPLKCPHCGTSGSLVLHYGPGSGPEEADVLVAMQRTPAVGNPGADPTPGID